MHDRLKDKYFDEVMFCVRPITVDDSVNKSNTKMRPDAIILDGYAKRFCTECYDEYKQKGKNERELFDGTAK